MAAANAAREIARPGEETNDGPMPRDRRVAISEAKEILEHIRQARRLLERLEENPAVEAENRQDPVDDYLEMASYDVRLLLGVLQNRP